MSASPYREPGPLPRSERVWSSRRLLDVAVKLVGMLAVAAFVLVFFLHRSSATSRLTLADPKPSQPPGSAEESAPEAPARPPRLGTPFPGVPGGEHRTAATSLTSDQVMSVVKSHQGEIRRSCIEGLGSRAGTEEHVALTIDGEGHVTTAAADGNNPLVGACLEAEARAWVFTPTGATTYVRIPFVFVAQ